MELQYCSTVCARYTSRCAAMKDGTIRHPCVRQLAACSMKNT